MAFWAESTHCELIFSFSSTTTLRSFYTGLLSIQSSLSLYSRLGLPLPGCRMLHLALLNIMSLAWAHLSNLSQSLPMKRKSTTESLDQHHFSYRISIRATSTGKVVESPLKSRLLSLCQPASPATKVAFLPHL